MQKTVKILTILIISISINLVGQEAISGDVNMPNNLCKHYVDHEFDGTEFPEEINNWPLGIPDYFNLCKIENSISKTQKSRRQGNEAATGIAAIFGIPAPAIIANCASSYDWPNFEEECVDKKLESYERQAKGLSIYSECKIESEEQLINALKQPTSEYKKFKTNKDVLSKTLHVDTGWVQDWTCATGFKLRRPAQFLLNIHDGEATGQSNEMSCEDKCGVLEYIDGKFWETIKVEFIGGKKTRTLLQNEATESSNSEEHSTNSSCVKMLDKKKLGIPINDNYCAKQTKKSYSWVNSGEDNIDSYEKIREYERKGYTVVINKEIELSDNITLTKPITLKPDIFRHLHRIIIRGNNNSILIKGANPNKEADIPWINNEGPHTLNIEKIKFSGDRLPIGSTVKPLRIVDSEFETKGTALKPSKLWVIANNTFNNSSDEPTISLGTIDYKYLVYPNSNEWKKDVGLFDYYKQSKLDYDAFIDNLVQNELQKEKKEQCEKKKYPDLILLCEEKVEEDFDFEHWKEEKENFYTNKYLADHAKLVIDRIYGAQPEGDYNLILNNTFQGSSIAFEVNSNSFSNTTHNNTFKTSANEMENALVIKSNSDNLAANKFFENPILKQVAGYTIILEVDNSTEAIEIFAQSNDSFKKTHTLCNKEVSINLSSVTCNDFFEAVNTTNNLMEVEIYFPFTATQVQARSLGSTYTGLIADIHDELEKGYSFLYNHRTPSEFVTIDMHASEEAWQKSYNDHEAEKEKAKFLELMAILEMKDNNDKTDLKGAIETHCSKYAAPRIVKRREERCANDCSNGENSTYCKQQCSQEDLNFEKQKHICIVQKACAFPYRPVTPEPCISYYQYQKDYKFDSSPLITKQSKWWKYFAEAYNPCIDSFCTSGDNSCSGTLIAKEISDEPSDAIQKCMYTNACSSWNKIETHTVCSNYEGTSCINEKKQADLKPIFLKPNDEIISVEEKCSTITDEDKETYLFASTASGNTSSEDCQWYQKWEPTQYECVTLDCYNNGSAETGWKIENNKCIRTSCNNPAYYIDDNKCVPCPSGKVATDDWNNCIESECNIDSDCTGANVSCNSHKCELNECPEGYFAKEWGCQEIDPDDDLEETEDPELPLDDGDDIGSEDDFLIDGYVTSDDDNKNNSIQTVETNTGSGGCSLINPDKKQKTPALFLIIFLTLVLIYRKRIQI